MKRVPVNHIRRNLNTLNERDIQSLQSALRDLEEDTTNDGWANLASFHGAPARCPDPAHPSVACCQHGMPTFPHWHRLFTLQVNILSFLHESCSQVRNSSNVIFFFCLTNYLFFTLTDAQHFLLFRKTYLNNYKLFVAAKLAVILFI